MNSLYSAGGLIGYLTAGWLANKMGRKRSIQIICAICVAASVFTTASVNIGMFLAGRGIQGLGLGMTDTICPLYQSEISPAHGRGRMVGMHAVFLASGYADASWVGLGCYFEDNPDIQWRLCIAFQILAPLMLLLGSHVIPESPRYLIYNRRDEEGLQVLMKLHSYSEDLDSRYAYAEFEQIKQQVELDRASERSWLALWKAPNTRKRMIFGFLVIAIAQSSGVLIVLYEGLGITGWKAILLLSIYTSWAAFMNWINAILLDRIGRIKLMVIGMIYWGGDRNLMRERHGREVRSVYLSEIFPTWMRAQGVSFSVAGLFTTTLLYTGSASVAFSKIGWKYYLVFIFASLVATGVIWCFFPETNGLSLEQIGVLFGDEVATAAPELTANGMKGVHTLTTGIEVSDGDMNGSRDAKESKELKV
ncbi:uncharacterized protein BKA55DRAFT_696611 [Fusarium redolens]|uniref:Major facilitator superfamily (MFS) profile domain-containing protein n=1 Tax=Fusarium redolens TaxID=48865 RepID=A0A9P9FYG1_FUSRE|nr:uncharacterized protein BKA55DRAFT_696611 [Fusarium redolens]KAH7230050.1 hypothetical protein BKA55DRAFT_696611 [Fusarium redolens]